MVSSSKKWLIAAVLVFALGAITPTGSAYALCAAQPDDDQWIHLSGSSSLTELDIQIGCSDQIHCSVNRCQS